jgi:hypothetical protein
VITANQAIVNAIQGNKSSILIEVKECSDTFSCNNQGTCDRGADPYDGNFTCVCNSGWTGDAACSIESQSASSASAIGGTAGGFVLVIAMVFGIISWRAYKRSIAPIDFKAKVKEMIASGEIDVGSGEIVASDLPREIQRRHLTKMETIGTVSSMGLVLFLLLLHLHYLFWISYFYVFFQLPFIILFGATHTVL